MINWNIRMLQTQTGNVSRTSDGNIEPPRTFKYEMIKYMPNVIPILAIKVSYSITFDHCQLTRVAITIVYEISDEVLSELLSKQYALLGMHIPGLFLNMKRLNTFTSKTD